MPVGTNGNDFLLFEGTVQTLDTTVTNPYTGETVHLNDTFNVNTSTYNGLAGNDTLLMTNNGDALFLDGAGGAPTVMNVETFSAGQGGDAIILSSSINALGNIVIDGGLGNDTLWGNNGDDRILGRAGDDHLLGGGGNDLLNGVDDQDYLNGGIGADSLVGGTGNDILAFWGDSFWDPSFSISMNGGVDQTANGNVEIQLTSDHARSFDSFDGGAGYDVLLGTAGNDVILLQDGLSPFNPFASGARMSGIEEINGGAGSDIVDLYSSLYSYGDALLYGGSGDDFLRGGAGNDTLYGGVNTPLIQVSKTFIDSVAFPSLIEGTDIVDLVPPGTPSLGVVHGNLDLNYATTATLTFREGFAGYNNTLGVYAVATDGTIENASILWANVKTAGINATHEITMPTDQTSASFNFFIIADGDRVNHGYSGLDITGDGVLHFVYDYGLAGQRAAKVTDLANHITILYDDGAMTRILGGYDYHMTERGGSTNLNWDGRTHVVTGLADPQNADVLRIGFEDLPNLGDADFEDVLFDLNLNPGVYDPSDPGDDVLIGGAGNDALYGESGDDILLIGLGGDHAYGGTGNDIIAFDAMDALIDIIHGFETGVGRDAINLSELLSGFDSGDNAANFVQLATVAGGTEIRVNADGDVGGAFTAVALIEGGIGTNTMNDLLAKGNLVLDNPVMV